MATVPPIKVTAKSGESVTIRSANPDDARAFNDFIRESYLSNAYLVRRPEEYSTSIRDERRRLLSYADARDEIVLLAEHGDEMVGLVTTRVDRRIRARHNIELGIALADGWRGKGLGRALMEALIRWAESVPSLRRLELHVLADNATAIALYESLGFRPEGRRTHAVRQDDGSYVDDIIMNRWVIAPEEA